jgi:hypothetical protein
MPAMLQRALPKLGPPRRTKHLAEQQRSRQRSVPNARQKMQLQGVVQRKALTLEKWHAAVQQQVRQGDSGWQQKLGPELYVAIHAACDKLTAPLSRVFPAVACLFMTWDWRHQWIVPSTLQGFRYTAHMVTRVQPSPPSAQPVCVETGSPVVYGYVRSGGLRQCVSLYSCLAGF